MSKVKLQTAAEIGALIRTTRKQQHVSQTVLAGLASVGTRPFSGKLMELQLKYSD
jgi:hypothetical protein